MTKTLFEQAKERVENSAALTDYADFILADWDEGDEHWEWVISATDKEILDWAQV